MDEENVSTLEERMQWFDAGIEMGATHLVVVSDTFDWTDFPFYVMPGEDVREKVAAKGKEGMNKIMEVFHLGSDKMTQFNCKGLAMNYDKVEMPS